MCDAGGIGCALGLTMCGADGDGCTGAGGTEAEPPSMPASQGGTADVRDRSPASLGRKYDGNVASSSGRSGAPGKGGYQVKLSVIRARSTGPPRASFNTVVGS